MSDFPPIGMVDKEDSSQYDFEIEDNTISSRSEAGYEFTRKRSTRRLRRIFKTGFTSISQSDLDLLIGFYDSVGGGANIFTWTDPTNNQEYHVRFKAKFKAKYVGAGDTRLYNVHGIVLKEV